MGLFTRTPAANEIDKEVFPSPDVYRTCLRAINEADRIRYEESS